MKKLFKCELCGVIQTEDSPNFVDIDPYDFQPTTSYVFPFKFHSCWNNDIGLAKFIGFDTHIEKVHD